MKRQLDRPRLFISAWYIGAGSLKAVFTRKPNQPFSNLKFVYGRNLEKFARKENLHTSKMLSLSETDRQKIKLKVREEIKVRNIKIFITLCIALILFLAMIYAAVEIINHILNRVV